jgi:ribosomal protein S28E/S33
MRLPLIMGGDLYEVEAVPSRNAQEARVVGRTIFTPVRDGDLDRAMELARLAAAWDRAERLAAGDRPPSGSGESATNGATR